MEQSIKRYKLNKDFQIVCKTGKSMSIYVIMTSVWFEPIIEEYNNISDTGEANRLFKEMTRKYKYGV